MISAYALPSAAAGASQTVAIVDAYDDPNAESDLSVYRSNFGLPPCTSGNGCFRKLNQSGGTSYPSFDQGWAGEISLDLDMVSAVCPNCKIMLVEATTAGYSDLGTAVNTAVRLGATQVSNSYGGAESGTSGYDANYNHPGVDVVASSGDGGYGVEFPASSQYVTAVGGTTLTRTSAGRGWSESAWSGAGSGCSTVFPKPAWQHDAGCANRTVADVSAVADPNTGVAVYDTEGYGGWVEFGGTSVAAPIIAAAYALGEKAVTASYAGVPYANRFLNDVRSGSNGSCGTYLCNGAAGYDGPTGLGTPAGGLAFGETPSGRYYRQQPGAASDIAVGSVDGAPWAIGVDSVGGGHSIYYWNGAGFTPVDGAAVRIAVDGSGTPWVVNSAGSIYRRTGGVSGSWQQVPGAASDIGAGADGSVWIIGIDNVGGGHPVFYWNGSSFTLVDGAAVRITVDSTGAPWVINSAGTIYRRPGGAAGSWQQLPGTASDIGAGANGSVWCIGVDSFAGGHSVYRWTGSDWARTDGAGVAIAVGTSGLPWVLDSGGNVFQRF